MSLDDLIDEVITITSDEYGKCMVFMIRCLSLVTDDCPEIGIQGIDTATKYWILKSVTDNALENARIDCWDYLDANSASTNIEEAKYCAMRAVICALYSEAQSDDNGELLDWFFKMLATIEGDTNKLSKDLLQIFANYQKVCYMRRGCPHNPK